MKWEPITFQFFEAVGIWQVKAVALDNNGETTEKELVISVENIKPIANLFVQEIDPANHLYGIHSTFSDVDGYVIRTMVTNHRWKWPNRAV